jgi:hypothetical protein
MRRWTKIFTLGDRYTDGIFDGPVSITEKVDGSQINFGYNDKDGLWMLSKGSTIHLGDNNKLFHPAAEHIHKLYADGLLSEGASYHGETLASPRHNTLSYERVPKNHIALYGAIGPDGTQYCHNQLVALARCLDIDVVPSFYEGIVDPTDIQERIEDWLNTHSYLGKEHIEGFVIKNYAKEQFIGGQLLPLMQAKFVSERFKERHKVAWPTNNKSPLVAIGDIIRTQARWEKAIQKLRDSGQMEQHPRDIGGLLKLLHSDIEEEDKEHIKEQLWKAFSKDIKRAAVRGFPEAYKYYLATGNLKLDIQGKDFTENAIT